MAFFALLWKARTIENYRNNYEKEKINSLLLGQTHLEQTLSQRWRHYRLDTKQRISRVFQNWNPGGSAVSRFFLYLATDQTFPNFLLKSVMGFVGGIILTYLCFMFFVFQLAISLIHATIMSSIIGVLLTLGLAFSYRIRCLVFLLIPQFFSRVGRYTLTCYALVLILTGPATNTLKNSEVLSESMACSQEQIKTSVHQLNDLIKNPVNAMKDSIKLMVDQLKVITAMLKETVIRIDRLVLSVADTIQFSYAWLQSIVDMCNAKHKSPYERCYNAVQNGIVHCQKTLSPEVSIFCNVASVANLACYSLKPFTAFCCATDFMDEAILASVKKKVRNFSERLRAMFYVDVHIQHSYTYSSNTSQVAAGIVTEIRNRADPLLTWLSWSSCVTSLFLLLIIFRAKYYQHMYETRSRFDNCYVTKELQELDLMRQQQGRVTVLPLNKRERAKYITTSSFSLVASEKVYLNRSAVFMAITTFKLLIHMVADYSLYWVLMTIRYHGRFQSESMPGIPHSGAHVYGTGFVARLFESLVEILDIPLSFPAPSSISCLPDPYSPDLRRYTQIGVLIFLLWFFALFEPYGLRLRHLIMGHYRPERAKARAIWLFNHILRTRVSFMKFARRKLHREYKYSSEASLTLRQWITDLIPFQCLRSLVGLGPRQEHCLLCGITPFSSDPDSQLTKCSTPGCPGAFCINCFTDIGELCTICLSPADYGDLSDVSLEKGSSDDSDDSDAGLNDGRINEHTTLLSNIESGRLVSTSRNDDNRRWNLLTRAMGPRGPLDAIALLRTYKNTRTFFTTVFKKRLRTIQSSIKKHHRIRKYTLDWIAKLTPENMFKDFPTDENQAYNSNFIDEYGEFEEVISRSKSIGVNTDRNRGVLLNMLVNRFTRRRSRIGKPDPKQYKKISSYFTEVRFKQHRNIKINHHIQKQTDIERSKITLFSTKYFHTHNLTICLRNLKAIVSKKDNSTKTTMKRNNEPKGIITALRYFQNSNGTSVSNQNSGNTSSSSRTESKREIINSKLNGKNNKKSCSKSNKPKRPRRQKDVIKILKKNSRHKMTKFQTLLSDYWNYFKCCLMPCTAHKKSDIPIPKIKRNHKRRKKRKLGVDFSEGDIDDFFVKKDFKQTRNVRISAFLAELEWTKKDYRKKKDFVEDKDSFESADKVPARNTTTKIVNMVQLKSLPFQWREAPKYGHNKLYPKEALQRFRNRVTVMTPSSSLVKRMLSTIKTGGAERPFSRDTSICIAKRPSVYQSFTKDLGQYSDCIAIDNQRSEILDTDVLFKNVRYDKLMQDHSGSIQEVNAMIRTVTLPEPDDNISFSQTPRDSKYRITQACKCDMFGDIQRKWDHVKNHNFIKMKKFCSTLFGPSCTKKTCPNRTLQREINIKDSPLSIQMHGMVTCGCQTINIREIHTQVSDPMTKEKTTPRPQKKIFVRNYSTTRMLQNKGNNTQIAVRRTETDGVQTDTLFNTHSTQISEQNVFKRPVDSKSCEAQMECPNRLVAATNTRPEVGKPEVGRLVVKKPVYENLVVEKPKTITYAATLKKNQNGSGWLRIPVTMQASLDKYSNPFSGCQAETCFRVNRFSQYEEQKRPGTKRVNDDYAADDGEDTNDAEDCDDADDTDVINNVDYDDFDNGHSCECEAATPTNVNDTCTCATQHMNSGVKLSYKSYLINPFTINESGKTVIPRVNKKTQYQLKQDVARKRPSCNKNYNKKDADTSVSLIEGPSQESDLLLSLGRGMNVARALREQSSDTITERSNSTVSTRSDESKTDTTICSHITVTYQDGSKKRRHTKVITKANQATLTDKARLCDTGTITNDWWSPIVERKEQQAILQKRKAVIERHKKEFRELKEIRKRRIVSFKSRTQIIPTVFLPSFRDVLTPSRYLLESQKYYNELFAGSYRPRPQAAYVTQMPKYYEKDRTRSPVGSRRNHLHRKTKRLDECYSPIRQMSPRKRKTDQSTRTSDSPRRKSTHRPDRQTNNRAKASSRTEKARALNTTLAQSGLAITDS